MAAISVTDTLAQRHELDGEIVTIKGLLALNFKEAYLIEESEFRSRKNLPAEVRVNQTPTHMIVSIENRDALESALLKRVPVRVGGPFGYCHNAVVTGKLAVTSSEFTVIREISTLIVYRRDTAYTVDLSGN